MADLPRPLPPPTWRDRWADLAERSSHLPRGVALAAVALAFALVGAAVGVAVTGGWRFPGAASGPAPELTMPRADRGASAPEGSEAGASASSTTIVTSLRVHAAGAVARPGVVVVGPGSRVSDVVEAAGGPSGDADLDQVNLASPVSDGERVYVPRRGEAIAAVTAGSAGTKATPTVVNLNQATLADLESLPGVGPATAQAILDYRQQRGRFRSVDDLLNVRGIGQAKLAQIRPRARV